MTARSERDPLDILAESALHLSRALETLRFTDPRIPPLTPVERLLLQHVERHPGTSLRDLATGTSLQVSNASAAVARLVELELVERSRDPADARRLRLDLTPGAHRVLALVHAQWRRALAGSAADPADVAAGIRALAALDAHLASRPCVEDGRDGPVS